MRPWDTRERKKTTCTNHRPYYEQYVPRQCEKLLYQDHNMNGLVYKNKTTLVQAIKEHSINYQETRNKMAIILDTFWSKFISIKNYGESMQDYTRVFKTSTDVLESYMGGLLILEKYVKPWRDTRKNILAKQSHW